MLSTPLLLPLIILSLSLLSIYLFVRLVDTQRQRDDLKHKLRRYESLTNKEEYEKQLDANIQLKRTELEELEDKIKKSENYLRELLAKEYLIQIDEYEPKYDFVNSEDYLQRIKQNRLDQAKMLKENKAYICDHYDQLQFGENIGISKREIKKQIRDGNQIMDGILNILKLAFEEQCKYSIKQVSYNNANRWKKKITSTFEKINQYLEKIKCRISEDYLQLKLEALDLEYECEEKKQQEKETAKELNKQKKEREEVEKARQEEEDAEDREKQYQEELKSVYFAISCLGIMSCFG
jgi:DNA repair exonuclease SbcCD ATPase subunit